MLYDHEKNEPIGFKMLLYWSLILGAFVALGLSVYPMLGKPVPVAPCGWSHWWDVFAPAVVITSLFVGLWLCDILEAWSTTAGNLSTIVLFVSCAVAVVGTVRHGILATFAVTVGAYVLGAIPCLLIWSSRSRRKEPVDDCS